MKHIDDLLPDVVSDIIERSQPKEPEKPRDEKAQAAGERELERLKSLFE